MIEYLVLERMARQRALETMLFREPGNIVPI